VRIDRAEGDRAMAVTGRRALLAMSATAAVAVAPRRAGAQSFPSHSLTWVVPFPPGNIADAAARVFAPRMGQALGQAVIVANRPGAAGTIGAEAVARAAPDGHTLLYGGLGQIAAAPHLFPSLRFDPSKDLAAVHGLAASPTLLVVSAKRPWTSLAEFVAAARRRPEGLVYASPGVGTVPHLAAELLQQVAGVRLTHAPYVDTAQMSQDVMGGRVDVAWDWPLSAEPHLRDGRLRPLAVTDFDRVRLVPEVPTMREAGVTGAEMRAWAGVFVPARTPPAAVVLLAAAIRQTLLDPAVQAFFDGTGVVLWPGMDTERFGAFLSGELPRIAALIARVGAGSR
jgi:tripartite-type tricarboxylate transporter receptor subunit TctC